MFGLRQAQRDRERGHGIDMRSTLFARKYRSINQVGQTLLMRDQYGATRTVQSLVRRETDHIGDAHRIRIDARGNQAGDMRHIRQQVCVDIVSDFAIRLPVRREWITAESSNNQAWSVFPRQGHHLIVVELFGTLG